MVSTLHAPFWIRFVSCLFRALLTHRLTWLDPETDCLYYYYNNQTVTAQTILEKQLLDVKLLFEVTT